MKARLTFDFDNKDDRDEFNRVRKARDLCSFIYNYEQYLWKYKQGSKDPDKIEAIFQRWFKMLSEHDINMEELYP